MRIIGFGCDGYLNLTSVTVEEDGREYLFENTRWISVEERLPEKDRVVLVHLRFGMIDTGVHNGFTWWNDLGIANNKNVTHWMLLPPAPKEESTCMNHI